MDVNGQQSSTRIRNVDSPLIDGPVAASPPSLNSVLTIAEMACELRCSKAHVHNIVRGKVPGLPPLPVLRIGRRVLIRRDGLKAWLLSIETHEIEAQRLTGRFR
jgi:excisionase family DNA binding protein